MAADSPYKTLSDIRTAIIDDVKESTDANIVTIVDRYINEGIEQVINRKKRDWLDQQFSVQVTAATEATCTVTENSTTVTFEGGTTFPSSTSYELQFHNEAYAEVYNVSSITSNVVTLSKPYLGDSSTSATGVVFQPYVTLDSSIRHVYKVYHQHQDQPLVEVGPQQMREIQEAGGVQTGFAKYYTLFGLNTGARRLVLYPYPEEAYTIYLDVNTYADVLEDDDDEPLIPMQNRQILYWYGLYKLWLYHRNDEKAASALNNFNAMLARLDGEMRAEIEFPRIQASSTRSRIPRRFKPPFDPRLRDD